MGVEGAVDKGGLTVKGKFVFLPLNTNDNSRFLFCFCFLEVEFVSFFCMSLNLFYR